MKKSPKYAAPYLIVSLEFGLVAYADSWKHAVAARKREAFTLGLKNDVFIYAAQAGTFHGRSESPALGSRADLIDEYRFAHGKPGKRMSRDRAERELFAGGLCLPA